MALSLYMGEPLSGDIPDIAIDLYDRSLKNFAPSYLTSLLNQKVMNRLNEKAGTYKLSSDGNTLTATFDDGSKEIMVVGSDGSYTVYGYSADNELLQQVTTYYDEDTNQIRTSVKTAGSVNGIVPFATATWDEIAVMLKRHYAGQIDLSEYWNVGDTKQISYAAVPATGVGETHVAMAQYITIIGFNHDDLTNGGKAAVTLQFSNGIGNAGYMHRTATNAGGWRDCHRRTWCNSVFLKALDSDLQKLIKPVDKVTSIGNKSTSMANTSDSVFLLSETELVGNAHTEQSISNEGSQYAYYTAVANRKKKQSDVVSGYDNYWTRSAAKSNAKQYVYVESDGDINTGDASSAYRILPAFCM